MTKTINFVLNVKDNVLKPLTQEQFETLCSSENVKAKIQAYRSGNTEMKKALYAVLWNGRFCQDFYNKYLEACKLDCATPSPATRKNIFLKPTGLLMLDFDKIDDPTDLHHECIKGMAALSMEPTEWLGLSHITASGKGLRLVVRREPGLSIAEEMDKWSKIVGATCDPACKDLARISFFPQKDDILWYNPQLLFSFIDFPMDEETMTGSGKVTHESVTHLPHLDELFDTDGETYDGVPLKVLVKLMEYRLGGAPEEGNRHNFILHMAANLRWCMVFDPVLMKKYLPTYGLPLCEFDREIEYMCTHIKYDKMSREMMKVVEQSKELVEQTYQEDIVAEAMQDDSINQSVKDLIQTYDADVMPAIPSHLPEPMRIIADTLPAKTKAYGMLAAFPALGIYLKNVIFKHPRDADKEACHMVLAVGNSSGGKGDFQAMEQFILKGAQEATDASEEILKKYWEEYRATPANKKKPTKPTGLRRQILMYNQTEAGRLDALLTCAPYRTYVSAEELKKLYKMSDGKIHQFWEDALTIYDVGDAGAERSSAEATRGRTKFRMNWLTATTAKDFIKDLSSVGGISKGPLSRITIALLPESKTKREEVNSKIITLTDDDADGRSLRSFINNLEEYHDCTVVCKEAQEWLELQNLIHAEYEDTTQFKGYTNIAYRSIKSAFYRGVTLWLMQGKVWTKEIEDFMSWSLKYDMKGKLQLFGDYIRIEFAEETAAIQGKGSHKFTHLDLLPAEFDFQDLRKLSDEVDENNVSDRTLRNRIYNWVRCGKITRTENGKYRINGRENKKQCA